MPSYAGLTQTARMGRGLPGGDQPGDRIRYPAGATVAGKAVGGQYTSETVARRTGYGYVTLRYETRFPGIIGALEIRARVSDRETAEAIRDDAAANAPVWQGDPYTDVYGHHGGILRDSLYVADLEDGGFSVASDVHYAPFVEFGTINMPAQPFLIPAMEANRESYIARTIAGVQGL